MSSSPVPPVRRTLSQNFLWLWLRCVFFENPWAGFFNLLRVPFIVLRLWFRHLTTTRVPLRYKSAFYRTIHADFITRALALRLSHHPWAKDEPLVTIVIPCFNYGRYLPEALRSALNQSWKNLEVIVVDGGSTDPLTLQVLDQIEQPRVRVYRQKQRSLVGVNRNLGIEFARSKYVCCLDSDDILHPTYIEKAVFLAETQAVAVISSTVRAFDLETWTWDLPHKPSARRIWEANEIATHAMFSRQLYKKIGGFVDYGLGKSHAPEDWDLWMRLLANGARARNLLEPQLFYRVHSVSSLSRQDVPTREEQRDMLHERNDFTPRTLWFGDLAFQISRLAVQVPRARAALVGRARNVATAEEVSPVLVLLPFLDLLHLDSALTERLRTLAGGRKLVCVSLRPALLGQPPPDWILPYSLDGFLENAFWPDFVGYLTEVYGLRNVVNVSMPESLKLTDLPVLETEPLLPVTSKRKLLLTVPWLDVGGSSILLNEVFSRLSEVLDIWTVATNPSKVAANNRGDRFYAFSNKIIDMPWEAESRHKASVVAEIERVFQPDYLMVVGSVSTYEALHSIKAQSSVKVIDQLYNTVGHIRNNRHYGEWIDFNIVANTDVENVLAKNGVPEEKIRLIPHGIDTKAFTPASLVPFRPTSAPETSAPTYGFLGRLSSEKRPGDIVKVAGFFPESAFLLGGGGPLKEVLQAQIADQERTNVKLLGFVGDSRELYGRIDALILSSDIEGLPLTVLEAMAMEIPVIATRVGHLPSVIVPGVNGFLYPAGDLKALRRCLMTFAKMSPVARRRMGQRARETVVAGFDSALCAQGYLEVFESLSKDLSKETDHG